MSAFITQAEYVNEKRQERKDRSIFHNENYETSLDNYFDREYIKEYKQKVRQAKKGNTYAIDLLTNKNKINQARKESLTARGNRLRIIGAGIPPISDPIPKPVPIQERKINLLPVEPRDHKFNPFNPFPIPYVNRSIPFPTTKRVPKKKIYTAKIIYYREIEQPTFGRIVGEKTIIRYDKKDGGKKIRRFYQSYAKTINVVGNDILQFKGKRIYRDRNPNAIRTIRRIIRSSENRIVTERGDDSDSDDDGRREANDAPGHGLTENDLMGDDVNTGDDYEDAIVVTDVQLVGTGNPDFSPMTQPLYNSINESAMYNKFISYELNKAAKTFGEIFKITISESAQDNIKANSCFYNLIIRLYSDQIKSKKDRWREFRDEQGKFIPGKLAELLEIEEEDQDLGLTIEQSLKFFQKFSISLRVWDVFGVVHKEYISPSRTKQLTPSTLNILIYNNHVYEFDSKDKSKLAYISQNVEKSRDSGQKIVDELMPTNRYYIPEFRQDEGIGLYYIKSIEDMTKIILSLDSKEKAWLRFVLEKDLDQILFEMLDHKYVPKIKYASGKIIALIFQVGKIIASVQNSFSECPEDIDVTLENENVYLNYHNAFHRFYHRIVDKHYLSQYPEHVLKIERLYPLRPCSGYFRKSKDPKQTYNSLDVRKAYTSCMQSIDKIPVFGYFDYYREYDNHEIEDYTMYIVWIRYDLTKYELDFDKKRKEKTSRKILEQLTILFPQSVARVYGFKLKSSLELLKHVHYSIRYYRRPSSIYSVDYKAAIDEVYETKIHSDDATDKTLKKYIVNLTTGLLEKKYNKQAHCFAFRDSNEAFYYKLRYGGTMYTKARPMGVDEEGNHLFDEKDKLTLLVVKKEKELCEGMRAVKEMIYDLMSIKIQKMYKELDSHHIGAVGIKTDAILVDVSIDKLKRHFNDADVIGGYKFETEKVCVNSRIKYSIVPFDTENFKSMKPKDIEVKDEYDIKEISNIYKNTSPIIALGEYPGVGKTSSFINYHKETNTRILFATPYNKLAQALQKSSGCDCITVDRLFGTRPDRSGNHQVMHGSMPYPIENYDMIVFDEVGLHGPSKLKAIAQYIDSNKGTKKFAATMDCDQLPPIEQLNNVGDDPKKIKAYHMSCIYQIFPNRIIYKIPKRVNTDEERKILYGLKRDMFSDMNIVDIINKYKFKSISNLKDLKTKQNVCYFKYRTDIVNHYVHNTLIKAPPKGSLIRAGNVRYWPGLYILCKEYYKNGDYEIRTNYEYKIQKISVNKFTILNEQDKTTTTMETSMIMKKFKLPYANTCHCVQGLSIPEPMTIFDANTPYAQREYIWTAITRATKLSDITFFIHPESEIQALTLSKKKQYFKFKVTRYKEQDDKARRKYNAKEYIDADWIMDEIEKKYNFQCPKCSVPFEIELQSAEYGARSNITVDRKDNTKAHLKSNCSLLCLRCNVTKRDDGPGRVLQKASKQALKEKKTKQQETEYDTQIDTFNQLFDL